VVPLTGASIVPDESFSLRLGDVVTIDIRCLDTLTSLVRVDRDLDQE